MARDVTFPWAFNSTAFSRGDGIPLFDEAMSVAQEHCIYRAANGYTPAMVMREAGVVPRVPFSGWDDALGAVGGQWLDLLLGPERARAA